MPLIARRDLLSGSALILLTAAHPALAARPLGQFAPRGDGRIDHTAFDRLLAAYVRPDAAGYNRVDYRGLKNEAHDALKTYVVELESARPTALSRSQAHAYWINLYNAKTLDVVLDDYPVRSIKDIRLGGGGLFGSGPWSRKLMAVEGQDLSLDDVEHRIVRALFDDPMSHYGLNCASYSCPNLAVRAFTGANVEELLNENARAYVNHPRGVAVRSGRITASKIYAWYAADFGGRPQLKTHWRVFAAPDHRAAIDAASLGRFVYDWSLNDTV